MELRRELHAPMAQVRTVQKAQDRCGCFVGENLIQRGRPAQSLYLQLGLCSCGTWVFKFIWRRATFVTGGWFEGRMWENNE